MDDLNIQQLIDDSLREKENSREKKEQISWHISSIGSCMRGQYLSRQGAKPDTEIDNRLLRVFDKGNKEEAWLIGLIKENKKVRDGLITVEEQVRVEDKDLGISGRADLLLQQGDKKRLYEIKSKNSLSFRYMIGPYGKGPQREHEYQLWTYLYLLDIPEGRLVYSSKDNSLILEFIVYRNNQALKTEVMDYLTKLNWCWKEKVLPPLPDKTSWQAKYCKFHKQCLALEKKKI
jgi:hypothetical protein